MQAVLQQHSRRRSGVLARATRATALTAAALAALTIASLIHDSGRAAAQWPFWSEPAPAPLTVPLPVLPDNASPFAFGFLVFDWDPTAPGGVPGFDVWPSDSRPR